MPSIIRPSDFTEATSQHATLWNPAVLQRMIPFLAGQRVIVCTDRGNGHAMEGYIVGIQSGTRHSDDPHILISNAHDDTDGRLIGVHNLGEIVVLSNANVRWNTSTAIFNETTEALRLVKQFIGADFPAGAPYKGQRKWTVTVVWDGVQVAWGESYRDRRWMVRDGHVTVA